MVVRRGLFLVFEALYKVTAIQLFATAFHRIRARCITLHRMRRTGSPKQCSPPRNVVTLR